MAERRDLRHRLTVVLSRVQPLRLEQLDPRELTARRAHRACGVTGERRFALGHERAPCVRDAAHEGEQIAAIFDPRHDRRLVGDDLGVAERPRHRVARPVEPAGLERREQSVDADRGVDRERERGAIQHRHRDRQRLPRRRFAQLDECAHHRVDVPRHLYRVPSCRRCVQAE